VSLVSTFVSIPSDKFVSNMDLSNYFDRVIVINLKRRPDRLVSFNASMQECNWPFRPPVVFAAIDGRIVPSPEGWQSGVGAWGCLRSHQRVLEEAMMEGIEKLLVLEDDVCFTSDFVSNVSAFLSSVPEDWDQLMFGGQHCNFHGVPVLKCPGVYRCSDCERTHCYAIRGKFLKRLYQRWVGGGKFNGKVHCDWIMGRDPELQFTHNVYAPERFLVGQERGKSDIVGGLQAKRFWNPPARDLPIIVLRSPRSVVDELRQYGLHTGFRRDAETGLDMGLLKIFSETANTPTERIQRLGKWIEEIQWEVASDPYLICTVWHPEAHLHLVEMAAQRPVCRIAVSKVEDALLQLLRLFPRKRRPSLASIGVILLESSRVVMDGVREFGWHGGFSLDPATGRNGFIDQLCRDFSERGRRIEALSYAIKLLQIEAEQIPKGVVVIWHPEIDAAMVEAATSAQVVKIAAETVRDAIDQWEDVKSVLLAMGSK